MRNPLEQWSVTQQTQALYARSKIYKSLIAKRTEHLSVVWQMRRWLPFCKLLGKDEVRDCSLLLYGQIQLTWVEAQRQRSKPLDQIKDRWMHRRGVQLRKRIEKWSMVYTNTFVSSMENLDGM